MSRNGKETLGLGNILSKRRLSGEHDELGESTHKKRKERLFGDEKEDFYLDIEYLEV